MAQVKSVQSQRLRFARAVAGMNEVPDRYLFRRRDLTSEEKRLCRHWARDGLTYAEMATRLKWGTLSNLIAKLKKLNIYTYTADKRRGVDFLPR